MVLMINHIFLLMDFTIFEVSKITKDTNSSAFGYRSLSGQIQMGIDANGKYNVRVSDGTIDLSISTTNNASNVYHLAVLRKNNKLMKHQLGDFSLLIYKQTH